MALILRKAYSLKRTETLSNLIFVFAFLYFVTSSADLLQIEISLYHLKVNHLLALALFGTLFLSRQALTFDRKLFMAFSATACSMAISMLFSPVISRSFGYLFIYLFTFVVYFILPYNLVVLYGREKIFSVYKAAFITTGILGLLQVILSVFGIIAPFVTQFVGRTIARGQALTYEPSYFALYMIAYVMFCNALYLFCTKKLMAFSELAKIMFLNLLLLVSTSTGAFFSYFIFFITCLGMQSLTWVRACKRQIGIKLIQFAAFFSAIFLMVGLTLPEIFSQSFWKFFAIGFMSHVSFAQRWQGIVNAWQIFIEHPWFGVGIGGAGPLLYLEHYSRGDSTEFHRLSVDLFEYFDPTNVASELLASLGVIGAVTFAIFFYYYFRNFNYIVKKDALPEKEKGVIYAILVSLIVMFIVLQFNQNLFRSYVWIHMAFCLGYVNSLKKDYV